MSLKSVYNFLANVNPHVGYRFKCEFSLDGKFDYENKPNYYNIQFFVKNIKLPTVKIDSSETRKYYGHTQFVLPIYKFSDMNLDITFEESDNLDVFNFLSKLQQDHFSITNTIFIRISEYDDLLSTAIKETIYFCQLKSFNYPGFNNNSYGQIIDITANFNVIHIYDTVEYAVNDVDNTRNKPVRSKFTKDYSDQEAADKETIDKLLTYVKKQQQQKKDYNNQQANIKTQISKKRNEEVKLIQQKIEKLESTKKVLIDLKRLEAYINYIHAVPKIEFNNKVYDISTVEARKTTLNELNKIKTELEQSILTLPNGKQILENKDTIINNLDKTIKELKDKINKNNIPAISKIQSLRNITIVPNDGVLAATSYDDLVNKLSNNLTRNTRNKNEINLTNYTEIAMKNLEEMSDALCKLDSKIGTTIKLKLYSSTDGDHSVRNNFDTTSHEFIGKVDLHIYDNNNNRLAVIRNNKLPSNNSVISRTQLSELFNGMKEANLGFMFEISESSDYGWVDTSIKKHFYSEDGKVLESETLSNWSTINEKIFNNGYYVVAESVKTDEKINYIYHVININDMSIKESFTANPKIKSCFNITNITQAVNSLDEIAKKFSKK